MELDATAIANELQVNTETVQDAGLIDPESFMDSGDSLFDDFTEDDLIVPENLIFLKNESVTSKIMDIAEIANGGGVRLTLAIESGDHAGKIHELAMFKPTPHKDTGKVNPVKKKQFVQFVLAFYSKAQILAKDTSWSKFIGDKLEWTSADAREWNGKIYQDSYNFKVVNDISESIL
jgi:hypothetical protein